MAARDLWLDQGLAVLAAEGIRAVTIDRLCADIGRTKGSFYHHFGGVQAFHRALLEHFAATETSGYIDLAEKAPGLSARERLDLLRKAVVTNTDSIVDLERATRAWASQDPVARDAVARIDEERLAYLERLLCEIVPEDEASDLARIIYLILLGSFDLLPPLPLEDVDRLWGRVLDGR